MDVASLRWFQQVADGVTVTEVSDLESVTQSGVSRALARLERELGVPLLVRSGRTLRMTRAGASFKAYVDRALHELDDGLAALAESVSPEGGEVSLAFQPSLGTELVPSLVGPFLHAHPGVHFALHALRGELVATDFLPGGVDLAITSLRHSVAKVSWRPLMLEPLALLVWSGHELSGRETVTLAEVSNEPFIMLRQPHGLRQATLELCREAGFEAGIAMECDDLATLGGLVAARLGIAIVPATHYPKPIREASTVALHVSDPGASRLVGLAWSTDRRLLPAAERFRDHILRTATVSDGQPGSVS
ncbi:LysR substrate-binding domain-containing protein [Jatrophihabitans telluris]|uniref:LysR substrate-binding domain-containing protein n=1 Tax=Jatrophihabitans telluris TaxID=2038343 RepID=A0ABY4QVU0_9ACTN|nr:LysR substrate-binding domain-containing protein [Jatrophihabitans telluris]UQX87739.1 LysR substrate-binding domain-containing protein [Jatrophihabitans telluris]